VLIKGKYFVRNVERLCCINFDFLLLEIGDTERQKKSINTYSLLSLKEHVEYHASEKPTKKG
jgi:hypothetical protein